MSFGDEAACMNQSSVLKSFISLLPREVSGGQAVPGNLLKKPVLEPKYCQDNAGSRSKLFAKRGSKWDDQAIGDCNSGSVKWTVSYRTSWYSS